MRNYAEIYKYNTGCKYLNLLIFILFTQSEICANRTHEIPFYVDYKLKLNTIESFENVIVEGAIGIIVTNEDYQYGDIIHVFNANQKFIKKIIISEEKQILDLKCLAKNKFYYKVELEDKRVGYIPRDEKGILFHTWEEHILSLFGVTFDQIKNPLRKAPYSNAEQIQYEKDEFYHPNKINGEWLQLEFGPDDNVQYAWIKWREKDKLLIEMFYFA